MPSTGCPSRPSRASIVGLIGANGSGKTTTLDVISGLVAPQEGAVRLDGTDLSEYLPEERLGVGMVRSFQDCRLFPELTVLDVLLLCEDARPRWLCCRPHSACRGRGEPSAASSRRWTG